jgi:hypothetical protein
MVRRIRGVDEERLRNDHPVLAWLQDWERLADARDRYAADLAASASTTFAIPRTDDGYPITERTSDVGIDCAVPAQLSTVP